MKETKFKQSEVGMIPSDWEVKALNELCECNRSSTLSLPKEFVYVDLESVYQGKLLKKQIIKVCDAPSRAQRFFEKGDILYQTVRPYQRNNLKVDFDAKNYIASTGYAVLHCKESLLNSDYLYQYIHTDRFVDVVMDNCSGTSYPAINPKALMTFNIIIPSSFEEQTAIANALSDVDTLIANLEKLIAKKKNIKQGAMQQLLTGKKRLPGFGSDERRKECHSERSAKREESSGYKMTELGMIPTDWEFVPVSELAKDMADGPFGSNLKKEHYTSDPQARIIQLSNIGENGWEDENTKYTTFEHAKTIARCIVPKEESILVAKMMPAGRAIICPKIEKQYVLGSDVIRITANEKLNSKYFVYASKSDVYLKQISDNTQGSTRQRTSISKLRKILILLPSLDEQTAIANVLSDMDAEISALETKLAKYRKLKTGMMQQLLTGKVRLV